MICYDNLRIVCYDMLIFVAEIIVRRLRKCRQPKQRQRRNRKWTPQVSNVYLVYHHWNLPPCLAVFCCQAFQCLCGWTKYLVSPANQISTFTFSNVLRLRLMQHISTLTMSYNFDFQLVLGRRPSTSQMYYTFDVCNVLRLRLLERVATLIMVTTINWCIVRHDSSK